MSRYILLVLIFLSGCSNMRYQRVVEPLEAMRLCGDSSVKSYSALTGKVTCRGK